MKFLTTILFLSLTVGLLYSCNSNSTANGSTNSNISSGVSGSGDDYYYEITTNTSGKDISINELTKMFVSSKGDIRMEMDVNNSMNGKKVSAPIIMIAHADKPNGSIEIDDSSKTYTVNHFDNSDMNTDEKINSTATKVGDEKVMGFNCVHARIISNKTMGSFYSSVDTIDLWKSNEVPQQPSVKILLNRFESGKGNSMYSTETAGQLKQMGCDGFTVKMVMASKDVAMKLQLNKVERKDIPSSLFEVPAGYKEIKE